MTDPLPKPPFIFRSSAPCAKNLLVINKGPGAVEIAREGDAWDLLEIYFVPSQINDIMANPDLSDAEHIVFESDRQWRKYRVMKKVFETTSFWQDYDSIMFADDDLIPVGCTIAEIFSLFKESGCRIGQPALSQDSYYFWFITIKNNNFVWRKTNFAEVMCPILTPEAIRDYLPMFDATVTNFGLDFYWSYHEWASGRGVALLDSTPMKHCRPVGGGVAYEGFNEPHEEFLQFMKKNGIPFYSHLCLGGVIKPEIAAEANLKEFLRLGLSLSGYEEKFLGEPKFNASYVKREIMALHEHLTRNSTASKETGLLI